MSLSPDRAIALPMAVLTRAKWAVHAAFFANGALMSSWFSRLPAVRDSLDLRPAHLGLLLLVSSLGSVITLPLTGAIIGVVGVRRTVLGAMSAAVAGTITIAAAATAGSIPLLVAGLFLFGCGLAAWDVAMNVEGADVEREIGRSIMPRFHAAFSVGAVTGAGLGSVAAVLAAPVAAHLATIAVLVALLVVGAVRAFLPAEAPADADSELREARGRGYSFRAWAEPRTLLIGLMVFAAALTEGAANDWLSLAVVEGFGEVLTERFAGAEAGGFHVANATGAAVLTVFLAAMTAMRFAGTALLDRLGRVRVLRVCLALAVVGLAVFALSPWLWLSVAGAVLWGLGAALAFPVGMSAAADEAAHAAARVSVVSTVGYTAFLAGPPLLGLVADGIGYRMALLTIIVPLLLSLAVTRFAAPPAVAAASQASGRRVPGPEPHGEGVGRSVG